ncbi:hypothetical protein H072_5166 [Dactylellina haptotyla CBS 200.50]|uniref:Uncharacterized protein n=1 Tax=Dactylellina haptotyla (strain CBS 200.50) TaxID=1284197 RepID=S8AIH9_DACHA|nr:hypothetical protein H072_5166 [Dactylellina haptotyla CBS 200.50]
MFALVFTLLISKLGSILVWINHEKIARILKLDKLKKKIYDYDQTSWFEQTTWFQVFTVSLHCLWLVITVSILFSNRTVSVTEGENCVAELNSDIGGTGNIVAFGLQIGFTLLGAFLSTAIKESGAPKTLGAGLILTHVSLAIAILHNLQRAILEPVDGILGVMILDILNNSAVIQLCAKETLAARWQVRFVLLTAGVGLVVIGVLMAYVANDKLGMPEKSCGCFSIYWWGTVSTCAQQSAPAVPASWWVYYAYRVISFAFAAHFALTNTKHYDDVERNHRGVWEKYTGTRLQGFLILLDNNVISVATFVLVTLAIQGGNISQSSTTYSVGQVVAIVVAVGTSIHVVWVFIIEVNNNIKAGGIAAVSQANNNSGDTPAPSPITRPAPSSFDIQNNSTHSPVRMDEGLELTHNPNTHTAFPATRPRSWSTTAIQTEIKEVAQKSFSFPLRSPFSCSLFKRHTGRKSSGEIINKAAQHDNTNNMKLPPNRKYQVRRNWNFKFFPAFANLIKGPPVLAAEDPERLLAIPAHIPGTQNHDIHNIVGPKHAYAGDESDIVDSMTIRNSISSIVFTQQNSSATSLVRDSRSLYIPPDLIVESEHPSARIVDVVIESELSNSEPSTYEAEPPSPSNQEEHSPIDDCETSDSLIAPSRSTSAPEPEPSCNRPSNIISPLESVPESAPPIRIASPLQIIVPTSGSTYSYSINLAKDQPQAKSKPPEAAVSEKSKPSIQPRSIHSPSPSIPITWGSGLHVGPNIKASRKGSPRKGSNRSSSNSRESSRSPKIS